MGGKAAEAGLVKIERGRIITESRAGKRISLTIGKHASRLF